MQEAVTQDPTVSLLQSRIADAEIALRLAETEFEDASYADATGAGPTRAAIRAAARRERARNELEGLQASLRRAERLAADKARAAAAADLKAAWKAVDRLVAERNRLAAGLEADLLSAGDKAKRLEECTNELYAAVPLTGRAKPALYELRLSADHTESAVRNQLRRAGFVWARPDIGDITVLPSLAEAVEMGGAIVQSLKADAND